MGIFFFFFFFASLRESLFLSLFSPRLPLPPRPLRGNQKLSPLQKYQPRQRNAAISALSQTDLLPLLAAAFFSRAAFRVPQIAAGRGGAVTPRCHRTRSYPFSLDYVFQLKRSSTSPVEREDLRMAGRTRIFYGPREPTAALDQAYMWSSKAPFHLTGSK